MLIGDCKTLQVIVIFCLNITRISFKIVFASCLTYPDVIHLPHIGMQILDIAISPNHLTPWHCCKNWPISLGIA